jgi:hypothetical protein
MSLQAITTDIGDAMKYAGSGNKKQPKKMSDLLREERELLFEKEQPTKPVVLRKLKPENELVYHLKPSNYKKYGRRLYRKEFKIPEYGRIDNYKLVKQSPEHNARVDKLIAMIVADFSEAFNIPESDLRGRSKLYHTTRVRNLCIGFLYAHVHMNAEDLRRNFDLPNYSMFRDRFRQMKYLIQWVFFARPYSVIYKKHKRKLDYDFKHGKQIPVGRGVGRYCVRNGRS